MQKKILSIVALHLTIVITCYATLYFLGIFHAFPTNANMTRWDALHFESIKDFGYEFLEGAQSNLAFFPLFPLTWKVTLFSSLEVSVANLLIFLIFYVLLLRKEDLSSSFVLFVLGIPSFIFFAIPYSESLFFAFASLIILGYKENKKKLLYIGFFGASLVKSVSIILIPALIITEVITSRSNHKRSNIILCSLASLAGICIAAFIQASQTGKWFYFIEIQKFWGRGWIIPGFPLTTLAPWRILGIDSIALVIGMIAIYISIKYFIHFLSKRKVSIPPDAFFSVLYLSASVVLDLFFTYNLDGSANLWSLNRHLLCSPFAIVFLIWLTKHFKPDRIEAAGIVIVLVSAVWFAGLFEYPNMAFYYLLFFIVLVLNKYQPTVKVYLIAGYIVNLIFQVAFFRDYVYGLWIS